MKGRNWLRVNQNIHIARPGAQDDSKPVGVDELKWYTTVVQDLDPVAATFCIAVAYRGRAPLVLKAGDRVLAHLFTDMCRYEFATSVMGWRRDNVALYELRLPDSFERIQLRDFVRLGAILDVGVAVAPQGDQREPAFTTCSSADLSAGGMRLICKHNYEVDTRLLLRFALPFRRRPVTVRLEGRVVRVWPAPGAGLHNVAVQFITVNRNQEDQIMRFIYLKMSEHKRLLAQDGGSQKEEKKLW